MTRRCRFVFIIKGVHDVPISMYSPTQSFSFLSHLKDHVWRRLQSQAFNGDEETLAHHDRSTVSFAKDRLYLHKVMCINYTTYDLCRDQDSINP